MKKIIFILVSFFILSNAYAPPPGKEINPDWPCIQVLIEELSWGSLWTGPPLDDKSSTWKNDEKLVSLSKKLMNRKTKEEQGIIELNQYISKNGSPSELTKLFHALFDTTNDIWANRIQKLKNFGKRQRLTSEKVAKKLETIKELSKDYEKNKDEIEKLEQEQFWDIRRFEDRRNISDSLCEQPRFYEKRLGVYGLLILEKFN
tara:strand:+ start:369 stop:977 length:609 start_codon:yes stop_codon:yes gene_type:complete